MVAAAVIFSLGAGAFVVPCVAVWFTGEEVAVLFVVPCVEVVVGFVSGIVTGAELVIFAVECVATVAEGVAPAEAVLSVVWLAMLGLDDMAAVAVDPEDTEDVLVVEPVDVFLLDEDGVVLVVP